MMKKSTAVIISFVIIGLLVIAGFSQCQMEEDPILFPVGAFPDSTYNLEGLNSEYDDYNMTLYEIYGYYYVIYSSNRNSNGGQFDLVQGQISFAFDRTTGYFALTSGSTADQFLTNLLLTANTTGNDFGPFRIFSPYDGYEYLIVASETEDGDLDLQYFKNLPAFDNQIPYIDGPMPVSLLNSGSDDAYITLDVDQDTLYFCSDRDGSFDIYAHKKPSDEIGLDVWFSSDFSESVKVESLNSSGNDKCPMVFRDIMIFASDRDGGMGGYDLYYSLFQNGAWNSPVNFGPDINTTSNEYRPLIGSHSDFSNFLLIFSSDRPGGAGNYDLYCRRIEMPK